jgi:hypothetical protein
LRWIKMALVHDFRSGSAIGSIGTGDAPPTAIPNAAIALVVMVSAHTEPQGWRPIVRRKKALHRPIFAGKCGSPVH